nr:hypothetical protein [uncultured bacterium]
MADGFAETNTAAYRQRLKAPGYCSVGKSPEGDSDPTEA